MPPKSTTKPRTRKVSAADKKKMLEEAPLFAALDNFVFVPSEKKAQEKPERVTKVKSKAKPVAKKKVTAATKEKTKPGKIQPKGKVTAKLQEKSKPGGKPAAQKIKVPRLAKPLVIGPDDILLSIREVCALLKISRATLVRMDNAGKLPGRIMIGGSVRFHRKTIDEWIQGMVNGNAE